MRTPRGLLATLGATLSMVAAAACVLFFTSTLVAVNGWPGLSAPPEGGPVALAPVERTVNTPTNGSSGSAEPPLVLGAPAAPSTPAVQVGVGSSPSATTTPAGTPDASERLASGAEPETTGPASTQETTTTSSPITIGPIPAASTPATAPAVQAPTSTPVPTTVSSPTEASKQASDTPSERRVALSAPITDQQSWESDAQVQQQSTTTTTTQQSTQQTQARRSFAPTQTSETEETPAESPATEDDDWQPSEQMAEEQADQPVATPKPEPTPQVQKTETVAAPEQVTKPDTQQQPTTQEQPAETPQAPAQTQPEPEPQADPCPPVADPCPPAAEQAPAPAAETAAPKPPC